MAGEIAIFADGQDKRTLILANIPRLAEMTEATQLYMTEVVSRLDQLGRLELMDIGVLTILATEYDRIQVATKQMSTMVISNRRSPLLSIIQASEQIVISLTKELGLSPKARKVLTERVDGHTNQSNTLFDSFDDVEIRDDGGGD